MTYKPGQWYRFRSTTEKIADDLNHIEESGDTVESVHHTGGRDWIILCRKGKVIHDIAGAIREGVRAGAYRGRKDGA